MSELIGLSFDIAASPDISFERSLAGDFASSGWGAAWYPPGELTAAVVRDPFSGESAGIGDVLHRSDRFRTTLVVAHLRGASKRAAHRDTHPFVRLWAGRSWTIAHDGDLRGNWAAGLPLPNEPQFIPGGTTDTEHLFGWLLSQVAAAGADSLAGLGPQTVAALLAEANQYGVLNVLLADGNDLFAYRDAEGRDSLWWSRQPPPHEAAGLNAAGIHLEFGQDEDAHCTAVVVASIPLSDEGWTELEPGELLVVRRGLVLTDIPSAGSEPSPSPDALRAAERARLDPIPMRQVANGPTTRITRPSRRTLEITHETRYHYKKPVERSSHRFRLTPAADSFQRVIEHELTISSDGTQFKFEDVFGNAVVGFEIDKPFDELVVASHAIVEVTEPLDHPELLPERHALPLVWMPWQHQMMTPYLLPAELPENELRELGEFAVSFAQRNRGDLLVALDDITTTIFRDFAYTPGSTTLETTPYQVFTSRAGVCQDFANLMITICRLLAVPARYRVGYIYTGTDYENTIQSEASHAWVEVYLPHLGWRGYDPTNGCRAGSDHVRVAVGRNYRDATPTAGVLRRGGSGETLSIDVRVEEITHD